jgi:hypothetical protein
MVGEISRDEFENWMRTLRGDIQGVHVRLDLLNGRTRKAENAIAVLEAAHDQEPEEKPLTRRDLKIVVATISGAVTVSGLLLKFGGALFHAAAAVTP